MPDCDKALLFPLHLVGFQNREILHPRPLTQSRKDRSTLVTIYTKPPVKLASAVRLALVSASSTKGQARCYSRSWSTSFAAAIRPRLEVAPAPLSLSLVGIRGLRARRAHPHLSHSPQAAGKTVKECDRTAEEADETKGSDPEESTVLFVPFVQRDIGKQDKPGDQQKERKSKQETDFRKIHYSVKQAETNPVDFQIAKAKRAVASVPTSHKEQEEIEARESEDSRKEGVNALSVIQRLLARSRTTSVDNSPAKPIDGQKNSYFTIERKAQPLIGGIDYDYRQHTKNIDIHIRKFPSAFGVTRPVGVIRERLSRPLRLFARATSRDGLDPRIPTIEVLRNDPNWASDEPRENMKCQLQVAITPTADTPGTTAILHFDDKRYVFGNLSEGTQRSFAQTGARLMKVSDVFLTGKTEWRNNGGLIGMVLTLADSVVAAADAAAEGAKKKEKNKPTQPGEKKPNPTGDYKMNIFGAPNLIHTMATMRRFVFRKNLPIYPVEVRAQEPRRTEEGEIYPTWSDHNIKVWAMAVVPPEKDVKPSMASLAKRNEYDALMRLDLDTTSPVADRNREITYDALRKSVVADMFTSTWRLDALDEVELCDVQMPATVFVRDPATKTTRKYQGPLPGGDQPLPDPHMKVLIRRPWPAALVPALPPTQPSHEAVSYIFQTYPKRGRFLPQEAKKLGVQPGKDFGKLTDGQSVTTKDGKTVTPEMVMEPPKDGSGVGMIALPSADYVAPLLARPEWNDKRIMKNLVSVIWTLGPGVIHDPTLRQFMEKMEGVKHIISSPELNDNHLSMVSAAGMASKLSEVDPARYSTPFFHIKGKEEALEAMKDPETGVVPPNWLKAERGLVLHIEPSLKIEEGEGTGFNAQEHVETMDAQARELGLKAQQEVSTISEEAQAWRSRVPHTDAEIIALGTGSALPSKYRNVSATLVRVPGQGSYLFDAGENTLGQIKRVFGPTKTQEVIRDLRMIWISHMHADHHLGTVSVIREWYELTRGRPLPHSSPLAVVSDGAMLFWLEEYSQVEDYGYGSINCFAITSAEPSNNVPSTLTNAKSATKEAVSFSSLPSLLGLSSISAVTVSHCLGAKAVCLTFASISSTSDPSNPLKISYSGDCRPSRSFATIGKGTTVLIHEATFDDELQGDALAKKHSTTSEALEVGQAMGAKAVLLTHFSQRYQKIPIMEFGDGGEEAQKEVKLLDEEEEAAEEGEMDDGGMGMDVETETATEQSEPSRTQVQEPADQPSNPLKRRSPTLVAAEKQQLKKANERTAQEVREQRVRIRTKEMKVAVAFDYMRIKLGDFWQMDKFTPALVRLLATQDKPAEGELDAEAVVGDGEEAALGGQKKKVKGRKEKLKPRRNN